MMVWSFIEKIYSVPDSKDYSGTQYPYVRITKLYDSFREYCRRYRMEPCAFKTFKNELVSNLELCFTKRGSQHAIYLVHANHPAFQASRSSSKYDFDVFASPSTLDIWQLFGRKKPWVKYDEKVDIKYYIRGGPTICLRKNFVLAKDEL